MEIKKVTLFLKVVIPLEAATKAIEGLAGLPDPESDSVDCLSQCSHLLQLFVVLSVGLRFSASITDGGNADSGGRGLTLKL